MRKAPPQQITLLPPDAAALLHLVRENLRLLAELATHYEVPQTTAAGDRGRSIDPSGIRMLSGLRQPALSGMSSSTSVRKT